MYYSVFYALAEYVGELICFLNYFFKSQTRNDRIMQVQTRIRLFFVKKRSYIKEEGEQKKSLYFFVLSPVPQYYSNTLYTITKKIVHSGKIECLYNVHTRILFYYRRKATTSRPFSCVTFKKIFDPWVVKI